MSKFFISFFLIIMFLVSCGDNGSSTSSNEQIFETSSSLSVDNGLSSVGDSSDSLKKMEPSSSQTIDKSSGSIKNGNSSSSEEKKNSSSSKVLKESSSSVKNESSSSMAKTEESSSSKALDESSSSMKNESSSSSEKTEESSSSKVLDESSSSMKNENSSSSVKTEESSSSLIDEKNSSSIQSSSSMNSIYDSENNTLTDLRDNRVYKTVTIGEQIWMAENLNYMPEDTVGTIYSGGTVCGGGENNSREDSEKCDIFGRLYLRKVALNKTTASNRRGICPDGWSIPQKEDWEILNNFLGNDAVAKLKQKDELMWLNSQKTNESNFSLKPTGLFFSAAYGYDLIENAYLFHWSKKSVPYYIGILDGDDKFYYINGAAEVMVGVRCIKD